MLSCDTDYAPEPGDICFRSPEPLAPLSALLPVTCCSCGGALNPGDMSAEFTRYKVAETDEEIDEYGDDWDCGPPAPSLFMCQDCANLFWFLEGFGYAICVPGDMRELVKEHAELVKAGAEGCR